MKVLFTHCTDGSWAGHWNQRCCPQASNAVYDWTDPSAPGSGRRSWRFHGTWGKKYSHTFLLTLHYTRLTALCPGLPGWASTRKVKPIWILLKHEIVSGSGISWAICKSAPRSRQITMPAPRHSVFYRPDALPDAQPTASKHWRERCSTMAQCNTNVLISSWFSEGSLLS